MMLSQKKEGGAKGCLVPILMVLGFIAVCYVFCLVLWLLNEPYIVGNSNEGGMVLPLLPTIF